MKWKRLRLVLCYSSVMVYICVLYEMDISEDAIGAIIVSKVSGMICLCLVL